MSFISGPNFTFRIRELLARTRFALRRLYRRNYRDARAAVRWEKRRSYSELAVQIAAIIVVVGGFFYLNGVRPPREFPAGIVVSVPPGESLAAVAERLEGSRVIPSATVFTLALSLSGLESGIKAGDYFFSAPANMFEVAKALIKGEFGLKPVKVTIPEGSTSWEIAEILQKKLGTDPARFAAVAEPSEGFLFPDTYFFLPNAKPEHIVRAMQDTFFDKVTKFEPELVKSGKSIREIVTMASLLEKEAYTLEQRRQIAGILWRRIKIDMPLQVDAVFGYIYKRPTFSPKYSHLDVDSPYNTYRNKGLPPGPIANPGLVSVEAALDPAKNDYLFYLSDREGNMHYSKDFEEHVAKKSLYLN